MNVNLMSVLDNMIRDPWETDWTDWYRPRYPETDTNKGYSEQMKKLAAFANRSWTETIANGTWTLTVSLPGVVKEDVSVSLAGRKVAISVCDKDRGKLSVRSFEETWTMPKGCNSASAKLTDGVLTISATIPEDKEPEFIPILVE